MSSIPNIQVVTFQGYWSVLNVRQHPDWLFVYGDNDIGVGHGGQAIIRSEPNAFGIPTKKLPLLLNGSFYTDTELDDNKSKIMSKINELYKLLKTGKYTAVIFPEAGLGTGLSQLNTRAPKTFEYLCKKIKLIQDKIKTAH